jgi:hypothetical protein
LIAEAQPLAAELDMEPLAARLGALEAQLGGTPGDQLPEPAAVPAAEPLVATLRCEGEFWTFAHGARSVRTRDSKGVRYIAALLQAPGVEIHAAALAGGAAANPDKAHQVAGIAADDAGPLLDAQAKQAYRNRLEELRDDIEEAESFNDPERAARAREEIGFIEQELARAIGLGGRDRKAASSSERARVSVTKAIRATIKRIAEHDPILARELETTVRTGTFCVHEPDPRHPLEWRVTT